MTQPKLANLALWGEANAFHEARAYRDPRDGKHYPSITSILKLVDKSFLAQYSANKTMEWAVANWELLSQRSDEDGIRAGKYRWKDHRDERAMVGDGVHNYLEALQTGAWDFPELDPEGEQIVAQYEQLIQKYKIEPILNEVTVADTDAGWFGTFDSYCLVDGVPTMVDFKTSKSVQSEHKMQLAALSRAKVWFIETEDMKWDAVEPMRVDQAALFHLRSDHHELVIVDNLDLHKKKFDKYMELWYLMEEERRLLKLEKDGKM